MLPRKSGTVPFRLLFDKSLKRTQTNSTKFQYCFFLNQTLWKVFVVVVVAIYSCCNKLKPLKCSDITPAKLLDDKFLQMGKKKLIRKDC